MLLRRFLLSACCVLSLPCILSQPAQAQSCSTIKNPVYVAGSTALEPLFKGLGPKLASDPKNPITLVYLKNGSCSGVAQLGTKLTAAVAPKFYYVDASYTGGDVPQCVNDLATAPTLDVALSDVYYERCKAGASLAAGYKDFLGPVETMIMMVPKQSTQTAISAEEAYYLFGFGSFGDVSPWTDESMVCIRSSSSGTLGLWSATIGLPNTSWRGVVNPGSSEVVTCVDLAAQKSPEKAIGIVGAEIYDAGTIRNGHRALAFRSFKQNYAYYPDSTPTAYDKRNVRDGRYTAFGYAHIMTAVDAQGKPINPLVGIWVDQLTSLRSDVLTTVIRNVKMVPQCAMNVARTSDGGDLIPYTGPSCSCFYEATLAGKAPARCQSCTTDVDCSTKHCNLGYCETR